MGGAFWYLNDKLYKEDGPAIKFNNGTRYWYLNGKVHREEGPAIKTASGSKCWYLNGKNLLSKAILLLLVN